MDVNDPAAGFGSADAAKDPTQHRLWKNYVTFHKVRGRVAEQPYLSL